MKYSVRFFYRDSDRIQSEVLVTLDLLEAYIDVIVKDGVASIKSMSTVARERSQKLAPVLSEIMRTLSFKTVQVDQQISEEDFSATAVPLIVHSFMSQVSEELSAWSEGLKRFSDQISSHLPVLEKD